MRITDEGVFFSLDEEWLVVCGFYAFDRDHRCNAERKPEIAKMRDEMVAARSSQEWLDKTSGGYIKLTKGSDS